MTATIVFGSATLDDLLRRLQVRFSPDGVAAILEEVGRRMGRVVVLRYPEPTGAPLPKIYRWSDGKLHKFKSLAAQQAFFAKLTAGEIRIPYPRTGKLARSPEFKVIVTGVSDAILWVSVPDTPKNQAVVGTPQSYYFAKLTRWQPLAVMLADQEPELTKAAEVALETIFEDLNG